jgi:hypothetical protein
VDLVIDARAQQLLAAVHSLVCHERIMSEQELLIATASELVIDGAATSPRIAAFVNEVWSPAAIATIRVEEALCTAETAGLLTRADVDGESGWALTPAGCQDIDGARGWAEQVFARTRRQLQEMARDSLRELTDVESSLFVRILAVALSDAVREAYLAHLGDVELLADGTLKPVVFERDRALAAIAAAGLPAAGREFLEAALAAALDVTDTFGNDLIGHLATGCLLHAFLAGVGDAARERLGTLAGEEFVIETPLLVSLLGPLTEAGPVESTIAIALGVGTKVVVPEHCIDELIELVDGVEGRHLEPLRAAMDDGMRAHTYAAAVEQGILQSWVAALDEGKYQHWSEFKGAAGRLRATLAGLGVTVRPHRNVDRATVKRCRDSLAAHINDVGSRRGANAIDRDAETMAMVLRHRRMAPIGRLWPGSWVVTPDRKIGPAYGAVSPGDGVPLTITVAQWSTLVARCSSTVTPQDLAQSTAPLLVRDAALAIATRYPPEVALELARTLSAADEAAVIDVHVAQMSLDVVIPRDAGTADGMKLASDVLAKKSRRMRATDQARAVRDGAEVSRAQQIARTATQHADEERHARELADERVETERTRGERATAALADRDDQLRGSQILRRRSVKFAVLMTIGVIAAVACVLAGWLVVGVVTAISLLVVWHQSSDWRQDASARASKMWPAILTEALALIQGFWSPHL